MKHNGVTVVISLVLFSTQNYHGSVWSVAERFSNVGEYSNELLHKENRSQEITDYNTPGIANSISSKELELVHFACQNNSDCPPWAYCRNSSCACVDGHHTSRCDHNTLELSVLECNCVTYDNATGHVFAGLCIENCGNHNPSQYFRLPFNVNEINYIMCEQKWNRTGRLCGKCLPGHSPLVYSFDIKCVKCEKGKMNIWKYIFVAFGPLTVFYFFMLFFKIKATSSHLHGYLCFSQALSMPAFLRVALISVQNNPTSKLVLKIFGALYSIWNLDILKGIYPEICLDVSTLTALAIDYTLAVYPVVLTVLSYILIELHDRNYRVIVFLWKPFRCVFMLFRRNWDTRTTVIDAYATFFLLSFLKVLSVSFDLLIPSHVHNLHGGKSSYVLYYDGTIDYFGREHLPYAILAILFGLIFAVLPTALLILYPFRWFQRTLSCLRIRLDLLHAIMDSFQGCYKDGTEPGTRDCRHFAAMNLIAGFILFCLFSTTLSSVYFPAASAVLTLIVIVIVTVQPYKSNLANYNKVDTFFLGFLGLFYAMVGCGTISELKQQNFTRVIQAIIFTTGIVPLLYMSCIAIHWILSRMRRVTRLVSRVRRGYQHLGNEESLPDRVANPEQYTGENLQEPTVDIN